MSGKQIRRPSRIRASQGPPAPPLPENEAQPSAAQHARFATISRVLGFTSSRQSSNSRPGLTPELGDRVYARPKLASGNVSVTHETGLVINSVSINEGGTHAVLAGRNILKTIKIENDSCTEDSNILAAAREYQAAFGTSIPASRDANHIQDVAWAKGTSGNFIAAATFNGPIILYDLNRPGVEVARMPDHQRQVHRVTFNPHAGHYMLSASQDGTVRMWDIRDSQRAAGVMSSMRGIPSQNEGIRDVKWSPTNGTEFAFCTDRGWIQKWDMQMMRAAKTNIAAHSSLCSTIDWHPDGKHLLSAGSDKAVRVWNVTPEGKRNKAVFEFRAPHAVRIARWRPSYQSVLHGETDVRQCTQLVTTYDVHNPIMHIWDLRRSSMPFRELDCYGSSPTDLLWHSQDLLWTVGRDGFFMQNDIVYGKKTIDKRPVQAMAISPQGEINLFTQTRRPRSELPQMRAEQALAKKPRQLSVSRTPPAAPQRMIRSGRDDTLDDNFLSVSLMSGSDKSSEKGRSGTDTPPSSWKSRDGVLPLDTKMERFRPVRPQQSAARGVLPGATNPQKAAFFAQKYSLRPYLHPPSIESLQQTHEVFENNAKHAAAASMYRLAQSWRVLGRMVSCDLQQRAERARAFRLKNSAESHTNVQRNKMLKGIKQSLETSLASHPSTPLAKALQSGGVSNAATPRAMAASTPRPHSNHGRHLPDIENDFTHMQLPPLAFGHELQRSMSLPDEIQAGRPVSRSSAMSARDRSRTPAPRSSSRLREDADDVGRPQRPPPPQKTDSNESFTIFPLTTSASTSLPDSRTSSRADLQALVKENLRNDGSTNPMAEFGSQLTFMQLLPDSRPRTAATDLKVEQQSTASLTVPNEPIALPERPRSQLDVSKNIQVLARNNQESFTSDTGMSGAESSIAADTTTIASPRGEVVGDHESNSHDITSIRGHLSTTKRHEEDLGKGILTKKVEALRSAHDEQYLIEDYLGHNSAPQPDAPEPLFKLVDMLSKLMTYHTTNLSDSQSLSAILLLMIPLLSEDQPVSKPVMDEVISHYVDHLTSLQLSETTISTIVGTETTHMLLAGLNPLQIEAILQTCHDQLTSLSLHVNAALMRRLAYPSFPSLYEANLKDNTVSFRCSECGRPHASTLSIRRTCASCAAPRPSCPICLSPNSPFDHQRRKKSRQRDPETCNLPDTHETLSNESPVSAHDSSNAQPELFTTCLNCDHVAHTACLIAWHGFETPSGPTTMTHTRKQGTSPLQMCGRRITDSSGMCPVDGCLCNCISARPVAPQQGFGGSAGGTPSVAPGGQGHMRRFSRAGSQVVIDDDRTVAESKAVAGVRKNLRGLSGASATSGRPSVTSAGSFGSATAVAGRSLEDVK